MQDYLKHYNIRITALSPIHVGDGSKIGKKEFIQMGTKGPVIVPDTNKMFQSLCVLGKENAYKDFMLNERKLTLGQWLNSQRITEKDIEAWKRYSLDPGDAFVRQNNGRRNGTPKDITCFVKDCYGKPYVPGSTLKGMLRSAILCWRIKESPNKFSKEIEKLSSAFKKGGKDKHFLENEINNLEIAVFHTLNRDEKKKNAVNSIMSGLVVSDSHPIDEEQLILAQKIDFSLNGEEKPLPILREALKPGTQIDFEITIDNSLCDITMDELISALDYFGQMSYEYFYQRFKRGSNEHGTVWLGGGVGFLSKTILYQVYGHEAVKLTDMVLRTTIGKNYRIHKHEKDISYGVSPHVCKCTRYQGVLYDMGMGKIEVLS